MDRLSRLLVLWIAAAVAALVLAGSVGSSTHAGEARAQSPALEAPGPVDEPPALLPALAKRESQGTSPRESAACKAESHTQSAFALASRGAWFAARAEFLQALRDLAETLDAQQASATHNRALTAALTALREARDFAPTGSGIGQEIDLAATIAAHRTQVLKGAVLEKLTPALAIESYFTFAQEQLAVATGGEAAGSTALYGLGKLHAAMAAQPTETARTANAQAMVFYQAALLTSPKNALASNDLGVLLAQAGRHEDARAVLEHSLSSQPQPVAWHNLSRVYQQLGLDELAQRARACATACPGTALDPTLLADHGTASRLGQAVSLGGAGLENRSSQAVAHPSSTPGIVQAHLGSDGLTPVRWVEPDVLVPRAPCAAPEQTSAAPGPQPRAPEYRLRIDDQLEIQYRITHAPTSEPYRWNVGDEIRVESPVDPSLSNDVLVQPDGMISLPFLGQVRAAGKTVPQLRDELEQAYLRYYRAPAITAAPLRVNAKAEALLASVNQRRSGSQGMAARVGPEGTIALPALGLVPAQGLALGELHQEINERYREEFPGLEATPVLTQQAPRFVYVLGEVRHPGRFELTGPINLAQAIGTAGGWKPGANLRQVVVLRRDEDGSLVASIMSFQTSWFAPPALPFGDLALSEGDVVIVPKDRIRSGDEFLQPLLRRGEFRQLARRPPTDFARPSSL